MPTFSYPFYVSLNLTKTSRVNHYHERVEKQTVRFDCPPPHILVRRPQADNTCTACVNGNEPTGVAVLHKLRSLTSMMYRNSKIENVFSQYVEEWVKYEDCQERIFSYKNFDSSYRDT